MSKHLKHLYRLKSQEGELSWATCNRINHQLLSMSSNQIPDEQVGNVSDYITSMLIHESALIRHREGLYLMLKDLWRRHFN
jgi:hypothetical protein